MTDVLFRFSPNVADLVNSDLCIRHRRLFPVMTTCGLDPPSAGSSPNSVIHEATACGGSSESASTVMTRSASRPSAFHAMLSASALPFLRLCRSSTMTLAASRLATNSCARAAVWSVQLFAMTTIRSSCLVCRSSDAIVFSIVSSSLNAGMNATTFWYDFSGAAGLNQSQGDPAGSVSVRSRRNGTVGASVKRGHSTGCVAILSGTRDPLRYDSTPYPAHGAALRTRPGVAGDGGLRGGQAAPNSVSCCISASSWRRWVGEVWGWEGFWLVLASGGG